MNTVVLRPSAGLPRDAEQITKVSILELPEEPVELLLRDDNLLAVRRGAFGSVGRAARNPQLFTEQWFAKISPYQQATYDGSESREFCGLWRGASGLASRFL